MSERTRGKADLSKGAAWQGPQLRAHGAWSTVLAEHLASAVGDSETSGWCKLRAVVKWVIWVGVALGVPWAGKMERSLGYLK